MKEYSGSGCLIPTPTVNLFFFTYFRTESEKIEFCQNTIQQRIWTSEKGVGIEDRVTSTVGPVLSFVYTWEPPHFFSGDQTQDGRPGRDLDQEDCSLIRI